MHHSKNKNLIYLFIIIFFINCEGEVGPQGIGLNSLTNVTNEPAGTNCENGGVRIEVGTDSNENGVLDTDEVLSTSYVCNGVDGNVSLTIVTTEPAGTNCENGGLKTDTGVDSDANGTLDDSEITATAYVCNGIDGNKSLTKITSEAAGTNCENGGLKVDTGVDSDSNGTLGDSEIAATAFVCNGLDGNVSLVNITDEVAGSNCENGGIKIDSGVDDNGDGTLDVEEIEITRFICNGIDGGSDEQIRIRIETPLEGTGSGAYGVITTSLTYEFGGIGLQDFDKRNYTNVDSIVLSTNPYSFGFSAFVELYDATNNTSISNSEISVSQDFDTREFVNSANIYNDLPEQSIDVGIRARSASEGEQIRSGTPYLILYRSN